MNDEIKNKKEYNLKCYEKFIKTSNKEEELKKFEKDYLEKKERLQKMEKIKENLLKERNSKNINNINQNDEIIELLNKLTCKEKEFYISDIKNRILKRKLDN